MKGWKDGIRADIRPPNRGMTGPNLPSLHSNGALIGWCIYDLVYSVRFSDDEAFVPGAGQPLVLKLSIRRFRPFSSLKAAASRRSKSLSAICLAPENACSPDTDSPADARAIFKKCRYSFNDRRQ